MSRKLIVRPEAEGEAFEAALWYEERSPRSGANFTKAFRSALSKVVENPLQYLTIDEDMRRAPVGNYPHGLLYAVSDDEIIILSCFHGRRDPAIWRKRR